MSTRRSDGRPGAEAARVLHPQHHLVDHLLPALQGRLPGLDVQRLEVAGVGQARRGCGPTARWMRHCRRRPPWRRAAPSRRRGSPVPAPRDATGRASVSVASAQSAVAVACRLVCGAMSSVALDMPVVRVGRDRDRDLVLAAAQDVAVADRLRRERRMPVGAGPSPCRPRSTTRRSASAASPRRCSSRRSARPNRRTTPNCTSAKYRLAMRST